MGAKLKVGEPLFSWFFQPPLGGQRGLLMIRDDHPGPDYVQTPFVLETVSQVLQTVEAKLPGDIHLAALGIFIRHIDELWIQIEVDLGRRWTRKDPGQLGLRQETLDTLWRQRETGGADA